MQGCEVHDQVTEEMQHAAWIFLPETSQRPERAAWIEWKDRLQMRRMLLRDMKLFGTETRNADHADVAVTPGLLRNPFDEIIAVPLTASTAIGFEDAARRTDDVDIAARDKELSVPCLKESRPQRRPGGLRRQRSGNLRPLQILVVDRERQ